MSDLLKLVRPDDGGIAFVRPGSQAEREMRAVGFDLPSGGESPEKAPASASELVDEHSRDELVEMAGELGIDIKARATKADIAELILYVGADAPEGD